LEEDPTRRLSCAKPYVTTEQASRHSKEALRHYSKVLRHYSEALRHHRARFVRLHTVENAATYFDVFLRHSQSHDQILGLPGFVRQGAHLLTELRL